MRRRVFFPLNIPFIPLRVARVEPLAKQGGGMLSAGKRCYFGVHTNGGRKKSSEPRTNNE